MWQLYTVKFIHWKFGRLRNLLLLNVHSLTYKLKINSKSSNKTRLPVQQNKQNTKGQKQTKSVPKQTKCLKRTKRQKKQNARKKCRISGLVGLSKYSIYRYGIQYWAWLAWVAIPAAKCLWRDYVFHTDHVANTSQQPAHASRAIYCRHLLAPSDAPCPYTIHANTCPYEHAHTCPYKIIYCIYCIYFCICLHLFLHLYASTASICA